MTDHVRALLERAIADADDAEARAQYEAALAWHLSGDAEEATA